jgi:hypothetical protein
LAVSAAMAQKIKERLQQVRLDILTMATNDVEADRVVQVNLQMFPVTKTKPRPPS